MTDRELLELAAKAVGLKNAWYCEPCGVIDHSEGLWNPLTDDGDALRLAVKLKMDVTIGKSIKVVCSYGDLFSKVVFEIEEDPHLSTRRAIVCAAAEIGKSM